MLHLLAKLPPGSRVLDLGAGCGSFPERPDVSITRVDLAAPARRDQTSYTLADAARLPFAPSVFDAVICNHTLEHFTDFEGALREIGRVVKPEGALYISVPDAGTLADRIYRWLGKGGGHVNPFYRPADVAEPVQRLTGLALRGSRALYSSFSFLNNRTFVARPPRKIALFAFGNERILAIAVWVLRAIDQRRGTRLSRYGWAFYFGNADWAVKTERWINVCVRCGAGNGEAFLRKCGCVRRAAGPLESYRCPNCAAWNLLTRELPV
jgi:SAM-dependent methyltransferase